MLPTLDEIRSKYTVDNAYLTTYMNFILKYRVLEKTDEYVEKHHIFPRSLFPSYIKEKDNYAPLSPEHHLIAHYYLYKAFPHNNKMIYSLNIMLHRGHKGSFDFLKTLTDESIEQIAKEYATFRKELTKVISKTNTGRKVSEENKKQTSIRNKNKVVVKDKKGNIFQVDCNDARYLSGELTYYRCGYKHTEKTKQKMSKNGVKGKTTFTNGIDTVYAYTCPEGYYFGRTDDYKKKMSNSIKGLKFAYNEKTGESIRIMDNEPLPEGFIYKRRKINGFQGWDEINKTKFKAYDIRLGKIQMFNKGEFDSKYQLCYVNDINSHIVLFNKIYFYRIDDYEKYFKDNYKILIPKKYRLSLNVLYQKYNNYIINTSDFKLKWDLDKGVNEILRQHVGEYCKDLFPLQFVKIKDITLDNGETIYQSEEVLQKYGNRI